MTRPLASLMAEQCLLGAILSFDGMDEAYADLRPEDFSEHQHRRIFSAILHLVQSGAPTNFTVVGEYLHARGELEDVGGLRYLVGLVDGAAMTLATAKAHAETIQGVARLRRVHEAARAILRDVEDPALPEEDVVGAAAQRLMDAADSGSRSRMVTTAEATDRAWQSLLEADSAEDGVAGARTGMGYIDRKTGGIKPGELWVVGARPSVGKTAWAINAALAMGQRGEGCAIVSLEMPRDILMRRLWANEAKVDLRRPRDPDESRRLSEAVQRVRDMPIRIMEAVSAGPVSIRAKAQAAHRARPLAVLIIDYLGLMDHPLADRHDLSIGKTTRALKSMAMEFGIGVVALHQLSRENEKQNRAPVLSDLRDSGSIEQDANVILFLHVPDKRDERQMQWIIGKNREGPVGFTDVTADRETGRFYGVVRP
jgi:replicative DNA helicase